jgi:hypothetical protein
MEIAGFGEAMVLFETGDLATAEVARMHVAGAELNLCAVTGAVGAFGDTAGLPSPQEAEGLLRRAMEVR